MANVPTLRDPSRAGPREWRLALAQLATGVAIVAARASNGAPIGLTINPFDSVSLEPPLVLWSVVRRSKRADEYLAASVCRTSARDRYATLANHSPPIASG